MLRSVPYARGDIDCAETLLRGGRPWSVDLLPVVTMPTPKSMSTEPLRLFVFVVTRDLLPCVSTSEKTEPLRTRTKRLSLLGQ